MKNGKFRTHKFHTNVLVPEAVAVKALSYKDKKGNLIEEACIEEIISWQENKRSNHHFSKGDTARHVDNLTVNLHVDQILREYYKSESGGKDTSKMVGVACHWYEHDDSKYV